MSGAGTTVSVVVEGFVDEAVALRLLEHVGACPGPIYGKGGKERIRRGIRGYSEAAKLAPWFVLVDLDQEEECAPALVSSWLPVGTRDLCFRVAVREVEAWLLADRPGIARFQPKNTTLKLNFIGS